MVTNIPREIRDRDPNLRFVPTTHYSDGKFILGVGDHVLNLSSPVSAYPGWEDFGSEISHMLTLLNNERIISEVERIGLRYINFFPGANMWAHIRAKVSLDDNPMPSDDLFLRTKTVDGLLECNTQIAHPAYAKTGQTVQAGSTIDLDASTQEVHDTSPQAMVVLTDQLHALEKRVFFGLLSPDFLATVNPVYDS